MAKKTKIIATAGGLLESRHDGALRIAVIHRERYDDWTLPKGHVEKNETLEDAAIREVEEETGCRGEIIEIVRPVAYLVNRQPKIVVFYRMAVIERGEFTPNEEVSELAWVKPEEALVRLSYEVDRALVVEVYGD